MIFERTRIYSLYIPYSIYFRIIASICLSTYPFSWLYIGGPHHKLQAPHGTDGGPLLSLLLVSPYLWPVRVQLSKLGVSTNQGP